jgi:hypothetical protein
VGPRAGLDTEARGKIFLPVPGIEPWSSGRVIQPVARHCTDWATRLTKSINHSTTTYNYWSSLEWKKYICSMYS